jgi:hypothetical protein
VLSAWRWPTWHKARGGGSGVRQERRGAFAAAAAAEAGATAASSGLGMPALTRAGAAATRPHGWRAVLRAR